MMFVGWNSIPPNKGHSRTLETDQGSDDREGFLRGGDTVVRGGGFERRAAGWALYNGPEAKLPFFVFGRKFLLMPKN